MEIDRKLIEIFTEGFDLYNELDECMEATNSLDIQVSILI